MPKANLQNLPSEWINAPLGNFYIINDKYASVIITDRQVVSETEKNEIIEKYKSVFLENCLNFFNKQTGASIGVSSRSIRSEDIILEDNYIDPFPNIGEKLLFSIDASKVDKLVFNNPIDYPEELFYSIDEYREKIDFISKRFLEYQNDLLKDIFNKKTKPFRGLDFVSESAALKGFADIVSGLITFNNLDVLLYEAIVLYFDKEEVKRISLDGFTEKKELNVGISYYSTRYPLNKDTTLNIIKNLDEVYNACKNTSNTYVDIVANYLSKYQKTYRDPNSPIERVRPNGPTYGITNSDVDKKFANANEISRRFVKQFQKIATQSLYQTPCLDAEQKAAKDQEIENQREQQKTFASELNRSIGDSFLNSLPSVLATVGDRNGKDALDALGRDVLNRLGVCGLGDLVAMVANTTTSFLDPDEYTSELTKCALDQIENNKLEKLVKNLEKFNRGTQILERYRSIVGSPALLPPWKTGGYTPPNSYYKGYFNERYSLTVPLSSEEEYDIDFLFSAYRDAVRLEVDPENILEALLSSFPDEMGWISFFIESTEILLTKCAPLKDMSITLNSNLCNEKRFGFPDLPSAQLGSSGFSSPSFVAKQLVEEIKNLTINLTVKTITASMSQLMQIIAAGVSFDTNYFKRGDFIPDLFQNEDYVYNAFCDNSSNKRADRNQINSSIRAMLADSTSNQAINSEVSPDQIDTFLRKVSNSIGEYEKIKLFKGIAGMNTYEKVLLLARQSGLSGYLKNEFDVEQFFLEMGKTLDVSKLESKYFNNIYNYEPWSSFCIIDSDMLDRAYFENKAGITESQVDKMKEKLKEIQKDKICFAANTLGNSKSPIIGKIGEMLANPKSDLYKKIKNQEADYFVEGVNSTIDMYISSYQSDLYKSGGVFDISMSEVTSTDGATGIGYNDNKFKTMLLGSSIENTVYTEDDLSLLVYGDLTLESSNLNETINIELEKNNISAADRTQVIDYFNNSILNTLIRAQFQKTKLDIKKSDINNWENYYDNMNSKSNIKSFLGISDSDLKEAYLEIEDFEIPSARFVPFNLLKSKNELLNKYVSIMLYIKLIYTEYIIKSVNMFSSFELETTPENQGFKSYLEDLLEDEEIKDNIIQILFKLPIIQDEISSLSVIATQLNESTQRWLSGEYDSVSDFYSQNKNYINQGVGIFVDNVIKSYEQENLAAFLGKNLPQIGQAEISLGDIVDKDFPLTSGPYIRTEKYFDVGTPVSSDYISGIVSEGELIIQSESLDENQKIKEIWPNGWVPGIRIVAIYPYSSEALTEGSQILKKESDFGEVVSLPLISYEDRDSSIISVKGLRYNTERMKDGLIKSFGYKNYFYPSMNIENIISFCTNYYIKKIDAMIQNNFNQSDFFEETKKVLLEI